MTADLEFEIADAAKSLLTAGWNVGKITAALGAYDSFGLKATSAEIKATVLATLDAMNERTRAVNAEIRKEVRKELQSLADEFRHIAPRGAVLRKCGVTVKI